MNTPSNTHAQSEQNQPKTVIDLQQSFAELLLNVYFDAEKARKASEQELQP